MKILKLLPILFFCLVRTTSTPDLPLRKNNFANKKSMQEPPHNF